MTFCADNSLHLWEINIKPTGATVLEEVKSFAMENRSAWLSLLCSAVALGLISYSVCLWGCFCVTYLRLNISSSLLYSHLWMHICHFVNGCDFGHGIVVQLGGVMHI